MDTDFNLNINNILIDYSFLGIMFYSKSTKNMGRLSKKEREDIKLSPLGRRHCCARPGADKTAQALTGILLGDGHIQRRSPTQNSRFIFGQTSIDHLEYFKYVFNLFKPYCTQDIEYYLRSWEDSRSNKQYEALQFATMALPCFNMFRDIFYSNSKKVVPSNIDELLTDIGLAHWIMDDGSKQGKGLHLNVYAFSPECVNRLINVLNTKFGLKCSIHLKNGKPRIYVFKESIELLISIVKPHMVPSIMYKLS